MSLFILTDDWCFMIDGVLTINMFFATNRVVWVTTEAGQKSQNGQFKGF